jgi:peptidoglycan/LPS O-acetylase OafA/YrhL
MNQLDTAMASTSLSGAADRVSTHAVARPSGRNDVIDWVKGALVILMVLYHWANYFVDISWDFYRYLRFLTLSFTLITGFLLSYTYLARYAPDDARLRRRLLRRGGKILLLFTVLNAAGELARSAALPGRSTLQNLYAIYVVGNGSAAFDVLVPIAYFLLLAPLVLLIATRWRVRLQTVGIVAVLATVVAYASGVRSPNLELVAIALLGMGAGVMPFDRLERLIGRHGLLLAAYLCYLAAITKINIPFPIQVIGVPLTVLLLFAAGRGIGTASWLSRRVVELGEYSLYAYIVHIVVLQLLRRGLHAFALTGIELLIPFVLALVMTVLLVQAAIVARAKLGPADRLYRVVFA